MTRTPRRLVDLSHAVTHGMTTYRGLPGPVITEHLTREASRRSYAEGTEFQIGRIEMVANTGTYLDTPFHRYAHGFDLAGLPLERAADLPGLVVRAPWLNGRAVHVRAFEGQDVNGRAVLVHTGWAEHWGTPRYHEDASFLTRASAEHLAEAGAALVGIDSHNIDDTADLARPAHSILLAAGIPIVEHLTGLLELPQTGFRFFAVPVKVQGLGTFPVRAFAVVDEIG